MTENKDNFTPPSRKKGTIALLLSSYASVVFLVIKNIAMVPLYLAYIDHRLYGAWLAAGSIIAYCGLLDFGLNSVLMQRVASNYGRKNFGQLGNILSIGVAVSFALSCIPTMIGLALAPWVPGIVHIAGIEARQLTAAFIWAGIGTSLMLAMYCVGGALVALQCQTFHGVILVVGSILEILSIIILLTLGFGVMAIPVGAVVWGGTALLGDGIYLWRFMKRNKLGLSQGPKADIVKDLFSQSVWQFGARSAATAARQSDNLIVGVLLDPLSCIVLTMTKRAADLLNMLVGHIAGAFLPSLAHLHGERVDEKFKNITLRLFKVTSLLGICVTGGYLSFNRYFVAAWVGEDKFGGELLTVLFAVYTLLAILAVTFYNVIFSKGEMITVAKANILWAVTRVVLSVIMVKLWGLTGIAVAAVIAVIPTNFFMQGRKFIQALEISRQEMLELMKIILFQVLIVVTVGLTITRTFEPYGFPALIIWGAVYAAVTLGICFLADRGLCRDAVALAKSFRK
ncbi:MAG: lipopolysaccharide biosynthesis protein [Victivallaceae bacterium]|nr:lipopolysaccharide biosynthesis protein [Victivallaceae bacterium]